MIELIKFPQTGKSNPQKEAWVTFGLNTDKLKLCLKTIISAGLAYAAVTAGLSLYAAGGSLTLTLFIIHSRLNLHCLSFLAKASFIAMCLAVSTVLSLEAIPSYSHPLDKFLFPLKHISDDNDSAETQSNEIQKILKSEEVQLKTKKMLSDLPQNKFKEIGGYNTGLLPYDATIVTAKGNKYGSKPVSYIDANFVSAPNFSSSRHIAVQAPSEKTVQKFFNMIIEHDSHIIATTTMLTGFSESQKKEVERCYPYWEQKEIDLGNGFKVMQAEEIAKESIDGEDKEFIIVRKLQITKDDKPFRTVYQYHYQEWPDHGAPNQAVFAKFNELINARVNILRYRGLDGPITAHCHAGSGPTGVFLAARFIQEYIESLLKQGVTFDKMLLNIPKLVLEMNQCRRLISDKDSTQYQAVLSWVKNYVASLSKLKKLEFLLDLEKSHSHVDVKKRWEEVSEKDPKATLVVVRRHYLTEKNEKGLPAGRDINDKVSEEGKKNSDEVAIDIRYGLSVGVIKHIVSSGLTRSDETATLLHGYLTKTKDSISLSKMDQFIERDVGTTIEKLETKKEYAPYREEEKQQMEGFQTYQEKMHFKLHSDMESLQDCVDRYKEGLFSIQSNPEMQGSKVLVIGHGNVMKGLVMECAAENGYQLDFRNFDIPNGKGELIFIVTQDGVELVKMSDISLKE